MLNSTGFTLEDNINQEAELFASLVDQPFVLEAQPEYLLPDQRKSVCRLGGVAVLKQLGDKLYGFVLGDLVFEPMECRAEPVTTWEDHGDVQTIDARQYRLQIDFADHSH
ncbi:MAG: hypothetical protein JWS12_284 [Candidatus Saccharibacteria bacterium]|nr:hypothetical protein [Candidatus Saccharibacteria bacterium]